MKSYLSLLLSYIYNQIGIKCLKHNIYIYVLNKVSEFDS